VDTLQYFLIQKGIKWDLILQTKEERTLNNRKVPDNRHFFYTLVHKVDHISMIFL
jgi:hypothetical protein